MRSVEAAQQNLVELDVVQDIEKVVAVKGYHKAQNLVQIHSLPSFGIKTYIPEPQSKCERVWTDKPDSHQRSCLSQSRSLLSQPREGLAPTPQ